MSRTRRFPHSWKLIGPGDCHQEDLDRCNRFLTIAAIRKWKAGNSSAIAQYPALSGLRHYTRLSELRAFGNFLREVRLYRQAIRLESSALFFPELSN